MKRGRRGMTLIEVAWAITASAVVVGLLGWVVSRMNGTGTLASEHLTTLVSLERFSQQFRRDVHAAERVERIDGSPNQLRLHVAERKPIEYQLTASGVERLAPDDPAGMPARESFALPAFIALDWRVDDEQHRVALNLGRRTHASQGDTAQGRFSVIAVWGVDDRAQRQIAGSMP